jgi:hypothetical protein
VHSRVVVGRGEWRSRVRATVYRISGGPMWESQIFPLMARGMCGNDPKERKSDSTPCVHRDSHHRTPSLPATCHALQCRVPCRDCGRCDVAAVTGYSDNTAARLGKAPTCDNSQRAHVSASQRSVAAAASTPAQTAPSRPRRPNVLQRPRFNRLRALAARPRPGALLNHGASTHAR